MPSEDSTKLAKSGNTCLSVCAHAKAGRDARVCYFETARRFAFHVFWDFKEVLGPATVSKVSPNMVSPRTKGVGSAPLFSVSMVMLARAGERLLAVAAASRLRGWLEVAQYLWVAQAARDRIVSKTFCRKGQELRSVDIGSPDLQPRRYPQFPDSARSLAWLRISGRSSCLWLLRCGNYRRSSLTPFEAEDAGSLCVNRYLPQARDTALVKILTYEPS